MDANMRIFCLAALLALGHSVSAQSLDLRLIGSDGSSADLGAALLNLNIPNLCVGVSYTLVGSYNLNGFCSSPPPFTVTLSVDGSQLVSLTGISNSINTALPASITASTGSHIFSESLTGGLLVGGGGVPCGPFIQSQLTTNQVTVNVINCGAGGVTTPPSTATPTPPSTATPTPPSTVTAGPATTINPKVKEVVAAIVNPLKWLNAAAENFKAALAKAG